ncbi:hypothetical protein [Candidatus Spongiihabitans sp.]|uniref:hypothetical protein n=1 Tax=Candidatus Spongiihabitans sp. TaxID=3101308 RepID=UPI003C6F12B5
MPRSLRRCWKRHNELRAVVFDPEARRFRQQLTQRVKGDGRLAAGLGGGFDVDGKAGVRVDEGEQVSAQAIAQKGCVRNRGFSRARDAQAIAQKGCVSSKGGYHTGHRASAPRHRRRTLQAADA